MNLPDKAKVLELSSSRVWLNGEGILFTVPLDVEQQEPTEEQILADMAKLKTLIGDKKVCIVIESDPRSRPPRKELRDMLAEQITSITRAMALVSPSPLGRMIANLFFSFKPPQYPVKMFAATDEAVAWIRQFNK